MSLWAFIYIWDYGNVKIETGKFLQKILYLNMVVKHYK